MDERGTEKAYDSPFGIGAWNITASEIALVESRLSHTTAQLTLFLIKVVRASTVFGLNTQELGPLFVPALTQ